MCSLVLGAPTIGWNFLFNLFHAHKALSLGKSWVKILKICKIRPLYVLYFSSWIMMSYLVFCYEWSNEFFTVNLRMISQPISPTLSNNFPEQIQNFLLSALKVITPMLISSILFGLPWRWSLAASAEYYFKVCYMYLWTSTMIII